MTLFTGNRAECMVLNQGSRSRAMTLIEMMEQLAARGLVVFGDDRQRAARPNRLIYGTVVSTYHSPLPMGATGSDANAELARRTSGNQRDRA